MRPSQIQAIERINMQAAPEVRDRLIDFYGELVGLEPIESDASVLRFKSASLELWIAMTPDFAPDGNRRRALFSVRSLPTTAKLLLEEGIDYLPISGMNFTDRRLSLLDPGGNRIELKQEWRPGTFPEPSDAKRPRTEPIQPAGRTEKSRKKR